MEITQDIIDEFRAYLNGRYSNETLWPDYLVKETLCAADFETGGSGWGPFYNGTSCQTLKKRGMFLYATAYLTSFYGTDPTAPIEGEARLNVAQKSVGDESVSYRVPVMLDAGDDFLTFTAFGQEFYRIRRQAYLGAMAL